MVANKSEKIQVLFSPEELAKIDTWRFQNHIGSRGEAIRQLIQKGLTSKK